MANLRCIALQEPLGKCIMGLLHKKYLEYIQPVLQQWPQFGFLEYRSTGDAIRRVARHCATVRSMVHWHRRHAHRKVASQVFSFCGGLQLFIDIRRAFDHLDRKLLFEHMTTLPVPDSLIQLLHMWHDGTTYLLSQGDNTVTVPTTRGVRQGCRGAPTLWNTYVDRFFRELADKTHET